MFKFFRDHASKIFLTGSILVIGGVCAIYLVPLAAIATVATITITAITAAAGNQYINNHYHDQLDKAEAQKHDSHQNEIKLEEAKKQACAAVKAIENEAVKKIIDDLIAQDRIQTEKNNKIELDVAALKNDLASHKTNTENSLIGFEREFDDLRFFRSTIPVNATPKAVNDYQPCGQARKNRGVLSTYLQSI